VKDLEVNFCDLFFGVEDMFNNGFGLLLIDDDGVECLIKELICFLEVGVEDLTIFLDLVGVGIY